MKGLSKKEIEIISSLEFDKKYFFIAKDIDKFAKNKTQRYNIIKHLVKKGRVIKLNRTKYYLVPIIAKSGKWVEPSFRIIDEVCNGKDYYIGGWAAANYWKLTDQIAMKYEVFTTRRKGRIRIMNTVILFKHARPKKIARAVIEKREDYTFRIQNLEDSKKWIKSKEYLL